MYLIAKTKTTFPTCLSYTTDSTLLYFLGLYYMECCCYCTLLYGMLLLLYFIIWNVAATVLVKVLN